MNEIRPTLFPELGAQDPTDRGLIAQYERTGRTLDDLPYTQDLVALCERLGREGDERAVLDRLLRLRKAGKLPKLGRSRSARIRLDREHERVLEELVVLHAGSLGKRDRLPYTDGFEAILVEFNHRCVLELDAHDLWRAVAGVSK